MVAGENPYQAPVVTHRDEGREGAQDPPASRGARLSARLLDNALAAIVYLPGYLWAVTSVFRLKGSLSEAVEWMSGWHPPLVVATLALAAYQWFLVARDGQTIGKKWMRIRIQRTSGQPAGFFRGVVLREWVFVALVFVPLLYGVVVLIDALLIFGAASRCLHDYIADTRVVRVAPRNRPKKKRRARPAIARPVIAESVDVDASTDEERA